MAKKIYTRSELVQLLPRQLSAITFEELCGGIDVFTLEEAQNVIRQAESRALPGKVILWGALETAVALVRLNNLKHNEYKWEWSWSNDTNQMYILKIAFVNGEIVTELLVNQKQAEHELQHLIIDVDAARQMKQKVLVHIRAAVRAEDERVQRTKEYDARGTDVETLIKYMPRDLTIGQFKDLIGDTRIFAPAEVERLVGYANDAVKGNV